MISDAEKINKSRLFSINYTMTNVGWVIGPLLGSLCSGLDGRIMFWISGVIGVLLASFFILYKVRLIEEKQLTKMLSTLLLRQIIGTTLITLYV